MKRTIISIMAILLLLSGCTATEEVTETTEVTETAETETVNEEKPEMGEEDINPLATYVEEGVLTTEESEALMEYLDNNDPKNSGGEVSEDMDPLAGAVEAEIITEEQAAQIDLMSLIQAPDGESSEPMQTSSTYTVEEANAIEAELLEAVGYTATEDGYPIVDTNQTTFFSNDAIIDEPSESDGFYGQDASYTINAPSYTDNEDGTVSDNVTGLMWQQDPGEKVTWAEAVEQLETINEEGMYGYSDWRIPTIKELYSLVDFSGYTRTSSDTSSPYIDTDYFVFYYGDEAGEPRFIDSQILSSTIYDSDTLGGNTTVFGYNFADGRIKGYEIDKDFYCYYVRGNVSYGQNLFEDNGDETITDEATSLMWTQYDSGYYEAGTEADGTLDWEEALEWVQEMNDAEFLGYSDWRLPNVKELQSLVDYTQSPVTTGTAAIDELFYCTPIINCFGEDDYGYYWTGTTHDDTSASTIEYNAASYVVFGNAMGLMDNEVVDAHGAGSQKSDPKTGDREDYPAPDENAPQGDEQRVYNMVRLVRTAE